MSWADLANQTAAIVQLSVWTHDVLRGALPLQEQNIASFLFVALRVDVPVRCFCHSGCLHIQDLIAGPGSLGIMLNTAAVWQWGMKAESRAAGRARVTFCMRLLCYSKSCTQKSLECHDNVVKLLIHKTGFECPEKATLKLELRREPWSLWPHPAGKGSWPRLSPEMLAQTLGFFLIRVSEFLTWASRWFRFPSMLCDFGWHSVSAHSGSLWLHDLSQHGDTAVSSLLWLPLAACWSWHVFQPWCVKVRATLNRLQLCVTILLPLSV